MSAADLEFLDLRDENATLRAENERLRVLVTRARDFIRGQVGNRTSPVPEWDNLVYDLDSATH